MWEPREAGSGGAALSTFPASSPLGGGAAGRLGAGCPCRHWSFGFVRDCGCLAQKSQVPGTPSWVNGAVGRPLHKLLRVSGTTPRGWLLLGPHPTSILGASLLIPFVRPRPWASPPSSLGKPTQIHPPVPCMSPPQSSRPQLSADGQAVRLLKSRWVTCEASVSRSVKWEWL